MKETTNPFPSRKFDSKKLGQYRDEIVGYAAVFGRNYNAVMRSGLTLDQIKNFESEEDLRAFITEAKRKYISSFTFLPEDERLRISRRFEETFENYRREIVALADVYRQPHIVIEDNSEGEPRINIDKSLKAVEEKCFVDIDNEELLRLHDALANLVSSFRTFNDAVKANPKGVDLLHGGALTVDGGWAGIKSIVDMILRDIDCCNTENMASFLFSLLVLK